MRIFKIAHLLNGLCFALPMGSLAWSDWGGSSNMYHLCIPLAVMISAFLTAAVIWPWIVKTPEETQRSLLAGGLIGVAFHPVAAILTALFTVVFYLQNVFPTHPHEHQAELGAVELVQMALFIIVWWCTIALFGVGWFTVLICSVVGGVIRLSHWLVAKWLAVNEARASIQDQTLNEEKSVDKNAAQPVKQDQMLSAVAAKIIALGLICLLSLSSLIVYQAHVVSPQFQNGETAAGTYE